MVDYSNMPKKMQVDIDAATRTKGLTILARILAASLVRKQSRCYEPSGASDSPVGSSERDRNDPDVNDGVGDEH